MYVAVVFVLLLGIFSCTAQDNVCTKPKRISPCRAGLISPRFFYNTATCECEALGRGQCNRNENNFTSMNLCQQTCQSPMQSNPTCELPQQSGPCISYKQRWWYNKDSCRCEGFVYGGCGGNANIFLTRMQCQKSCGCYSCDVCRLPIKPSPGKFIICLRRIPSYGYNATSCQCEKFIYTGCGGNANRFESIEKCNARCGNTECVSKPSCELSVDTGPCRASIPRYFYNTNTCQCEQFTWGGCEGNSNNFQTIEECNAGCRNTACIPKPSCDLPANIGPCSAALPRFFYNIKTCQCERFTWGGCKGNTNNFQTIAECNAGCRNSVCTPTPSCDLSADTGPCRAAFRRYFYNKETCQCEQFKYGGCDGNSNNFRTIEECKAGCGKTECTPKPSCDLPADTGPCRAAFQRYYYNMKTCQCDQFTWGGCLGNSNNFQTQQECENSCGNFKCDVCQLPIEPHGGGDIMCQAHIPSYGYNTTSCQCEQFIYTGCGGNANKFETLQKCTQRCGNARCLQTCSLPTDTGPCRAAVPRLFYNKETCRCEQFTYGGCGGNSNNFRTIAECKAGCSKSGCTPKPSCGLQADTGPCFASITRYFFDTKTCQCEQFKWGGCRGNSNNFQTQQECKTSCANNNFKCDVCQLPIKPHGAGDIMCLAYIQSYGYNTTTCQCEQFIYSGCGGNANKFETVQKCTKRCGNARCLQTCSLPADTGPCRAAMPRVFYNKETCQCEQFTYGGCDGNSNNFRTTEECKASCGKSGCIPKPSCGLPSDAGPCRAAIPRYFYNTKTCQCDQFTWGGCRGNSNNFQTQQDCESSCGNYKCDVCQLPIKPHGGGDIMCQAYIPSYGYNTTSCQCEQFIYTGCGGNANKFETLQSCTKRCGNARCLQTCSLPAESGPCRAAMPRVFYNKETCQCEQFTYGGCDGNSNNFRTIAECNAGCSKSGCIPKPSCGLPADTGPCFASITRYFFDTKTCQCEQFKWGGCRGNSNNFQTQQECETSCVNNNFKCDVCQLPIKPHGGGDIMCLAHIPSYGYNTTTCQCEQFIYSGCGGNANKFETLQKCTQRCGNARCLQTCSLPAATGPCRAAMPRIFYNKETCQCEQFTYGGCDGNSNNFRTTEECKASCGKSGCTPKPSCGLPSDTGPCRAAIPRYFYNTKTCQCDQFTWGGCRGNSNNFQTQQDCESSCDNFKCDVCQLSIKPHGGGDIMCQAYIPSYGYNTTSCQCEQFIYTGCGGNANKFETIQKCTKRCGNARCLHTCSLPAESGPCRAAMPRVFYNKETCQCEQFTYGGCDGNSNNFRTTEECKASCGKSGCIPKPSCGLPSDAGPCRAAIPRYFYNTKTCQCDQFTWGGCRGNSNNFQTQQECENSCGNYKCDVCQLPIKPHGGGDIMCQAYIPSYGYNTTSCQCEQFIYTGCGGNANKFETLQSCTQRCGNARCLQTCSLPAESGPCRAAMPRVFYNKETCQCEQFTYGGCDGNSNNFRTIAECEAGCGKSGCIPKPSCGLPADTGPCFASITRYFFDTKTCQCEQFKWGGCRGNSNNFQTQQECETSCANTNFKCDVCQLPIKPHGGGDIMCLAHIPSYGYNTTTCQCEQFIYSGCGGNANKFETLQKCTQRCGNARCLQTCSLPAATGPCRAVMPRIFYNKETCQCEQFTYGGCDGNSNNFRTTEECKASCGKSGCTPKPSCGLPSDTGPCRAAIPRYFYNTKTCQCDQFTWGGCRGNSNNFQTQQDCESSCGNYKCDVCQLSIKLHGGGDIMCQAYIPSYGYNTTSCQCEQFIYTGCGGNANKFETLQSCTKRCGNARCLQTCSLPADTGPCRAAMPRLFYNKETCQCEQFTYGGCGGNSNNFRTIAECKAGCGTSGCTPKPSCGLPADTGPCFASITRYFFDTKTCQCEQFKWGGCRGNSNNFQTQQECENSCGNYKCDVCQLPIKPHDGGDIMCQAYIPSYGYNTTSCQCEQFIYTGCGGNANKFETIQSCTKRCGNARCLQTCSLPAESGPCRAAASRVFYNKETCQCEQFTYGGCGGNSNNFRTIAECKAGCSKSGCTPKPSCGLPSDTGPCFAAITRYFYDTKTCQCEQFTWGGCRGNRNNFQTQQECDTSCDSYKCDVCQLPIRPHGGGAVMCQALIPSYGYNTTSCQCEQFIYTGCGGNANKFETIQKCTKRCGNARCLQTCSLPAESGPCRAAMLRVFYNKETCQCEQFTYGGCDGNSNNFRTIEECKASCGKSGCTPKPSCGLPSDTGPCRAAIPRYFYNTKTCQCDQYTWGGCRGNSNNFQTQQECETSCGNFKCDVCQLPIKPHGGGDIMCQAHIPSYGYNTTSCQCEQFIYTGCGGNANKFEALQTCTQRCGNTECKQTCSLPADTGPCRAAIIRYFYNTKTCKCEQFTWGGCQGNSNNFQTIKSCNAGCDGTACAPEPSCALPADTGPCRAAITRYFYNTKSCQCEQFIWGGCQGNSNNFQTIEECSNGCGRATCSKTCELKFDGGTCFASVPRYFYNTKSCQCEDAIWSGCGGNSNNFQTREDCAKACHGTSTCIQPDKTNCILPHDSGSCKALTERFYYDPLTCQCKKFNYGGCGGNGNRFPSLRKCERTCGNTTCPVCNLPQAPGPCKGSFRRFHFNIRTCQCEAFIYGGCDGNENRYETLNDCKAVCGSVQCPACNLPPVKGSCQDKQKRWYFDASQCRCRVFRYGGCGGNINRFTTKKDCEGSCGKYPCPVCSQPKKIGPCKAAINRWFYNSKRRRCERFSWGGCQPNGNNFKNKKSCNKICKKIGHISGKTVEVSIGKTESKLIFGSSRPK